MSFNILSNFYLPLLFVTASISVFRWRILSRADRWMAILLVTTLLSETISRYLAHKGNNFPIFHIYTPLELFLISLYFDRSIGFRKPYVIGITVGITGIILSIINARYFQPFDEINSYILLLEACVIMSFCMLSFYRLLIRDDVVPGNMTQFWLTMSFLFYSSFTFIIYGLYEPLTKKISTLAIIFNLALYIANWFLYFGIAIVFIRYKKLIPSGE